MMGGLAEQDDYGFSDLGIPVGGKSGDPTAVPSTQGMTLAEKFARQKVAQLGSILAAPGNALASTTPVTTEQMVEPALGLAGLAMTGGVTGTGSGGFAVGAGPIRAYHGSPHDFERFDLSKIGTGEGAQVYGHGLYFAENEGVARGYRDALKGKVSNPARNEQLRVLAQQMSDYEIPGTYRKYSDPRGYELAKQYDALMAERAADKGKIYEVNINADPAHFLDWDKPIQQQPRGQELLQQHYPGAFGLDQNDFRNALRSESFAKSAKEAGIPGIKYLDQGSRDPVKMKELVDDLAQYRKAAKHWEATGNAEKLATANKQIGALEKRLASTSNYVVFDDKLIDILKKYGLVGMLGGMGSLAAQDRYGD